MTVHPRGIVSRNVNLESLSDRASGISLEEQYSIPDDSSVDGPSDPAERPLCPVEPVPVYPKSITVAIHNCCNGGAGID